ncbi:hypothetical protein [Nocardia salmonicida]|uniref:hypothetical protein n=1 Tax=Nocardia salmonicida TaxID=53431 RepID=UPI002E29B15B|nr:hypothetical protein [Nocardia salmonicida]
MADGGGTQVPLTDILSTTFGVPLVPTANGNQQQSGAEKQQSSLSHGGTDPAYIQSGSWEVFEGHSHEDIYNAVQQMQPGVMQQFGDKWVAMFTEISGAVTGLMLQTGRASSSLDGAFASAGEAAGRRFITEATDVYTVLSAVGHRVKAAAYGAEAVKVAVPAPVSSTEGTNVGTSVPASLTELAVPDGAAAIAREKENRRLEAIAAMNQTYKPTYGPAGENVPTFVAPTQPGTVGANGQGAGGGGSNNGGTTSGDGGNSTDAGTSEDPGTTEETTQPGTTTDDETTTAGTDTEDSGTDDSQGEDSTNPASTTPASTTPGTNPSGGSPGSGSPGSGSPGSGSPGSGSPGGSNLGGSTPGAPVAGRPTAGAVQSLTAAGASGAASAGRGMSPGMMGAPGARGGGKDDEQEHQAPDYLRGVQPELLGEERPTVPEAIGADAPATRLADQTGDS